MEKKPKDVSLLEAIDMAEPLIQKGCTIYQKFTCSLCSSRQTIPEKNTFYKIAKCELCGTITDITKVGCGLTVIGPPDSILEQLLGELRPDPFAS